MSFFRRSSQRNSTVNGVPVDSSSEKSVCENVKCRLRNSIKELQVSNLDQNNLAKPKLSFTKRFYKVEIDVIFKYLYFFCETQSVTTLSKQFPPLNLLRKKTI